MGPGRQAIMPRVNMHAVQEPDRLKHAYAATRCVRACRHRSQAQLQTYSYVILLVVCVVVFASAHAQNTHVKSCGCLFAITRSCYTATQ
jgi:hypothetical protein